MATYENGMKPSLSQVKPLSTSETVEHDPAVEHDLNIQHKLVLRPWRVRFWDQFSVLTYKQLLVYSRQSRATVLRLIAPLFFMFLLWLLSIAVESNNAAYSSLSNSPDPSISSMNTIPSCLDDSFIRADPCWDFIYSPNTSATAQSIAENIRLNNAGRVISADAVLGFASMQDANTFLAANPERVQGGIHFLLDANAVTTAPTDSLDYVLQVNSTTKYFKDRFQDPTFFSAVPIQVAADREIARYQWNASGKGDQPLNWDVSVSEYAHPNVGSVNVVGQAMGPFIFAANMFNFVLLLSSVVAERERGLRQALKTTGMLDSAFWLSWLAVELVISLLFSLLTIAFGAMFQFEFFLHNSFIMVFLLFLMFQWAMVGVAFLCSALISKTSTAINLGFIIFIFGWVVQTAIAFGFPYTPDNVDSVPIVTILFTLLPFALFSKGTADLGLSSQSSTDTGITFSRRNAYCQNIKNPADQDALFATDPNAYWNFDCVFPLGTILSVLFIESILYFLLAIYLTNVLGDENGVKKKPWYFLTAEYWRGGSRKSKKGGGAVARKSLKPSVPLPAGQGGGGNDVLLGEGQGDADVAAEEERMRELLQHRVSGQNGALAAAADATHAVEVFGLQKAFNVGKKWIPRCCHRGKEFWAIKGSWLSIERGRLFCLLGPNGAGKTTTINCLTGVVPPTGGDALVYGESITAAGSMEKIRSIMGVCPQFDIQWGELTGTEHMYIYGRVKGLSAAHVTAETERLLESVKLTAAAGQRSAAYSGGMRRRLSVAMALLGDPLIVYLDEPTTGMDPISRRHVWDAIEASKAGRAIVLTTHSMEEADILGDTIAIMARGSVRAYGSSLRLKQRFGSGYQLAIAVNGGRKGEKKETSEQLLKERSAALAAVFKEKLDVDAPETGPGAYLVFLVPKSAQHELPAFLQRLESRRDELSIADIQISLTSLEEVFLSIARRAEVEAATAEGRHNVDVWLEDGSILEVMMGADEAKQESTGREYAVKWAQDESGALSVLSWELIKEGRAHVTVERVVDDGDEGVANGL